MEIDWQSQLGQDRFVAAAFGGKRDGTYIDIGAGDPKTISNTYALERHFGWRGVLCDIEYASALLSRSSQNVVVADARTAYWDELFARFAVDGWIDYLSLDLEPPSLTMEVMRALPLERYRFRIATIEHDLYREGGHRRMVEMASRMYALGYRFVGTAAIEQNGATLPIEDWWIHSESGIKVPQPWAQDENGATR